MEKLKLNWLGRPLIEFRRRPVKLETHKTTALLAYLSLSPSECRREFLATMFWPEGNQQKALANLRQALSSLKYSLPGWIHANRETIQLKEDVNLWVDVNTFHRLLYKYKEHHPRDNAACDDCLSVLESAAALYHGDFLADLNLPDAPGFDEWQLSLRESLHQEFAEALQIIALGNVERGQLDQAIGYAKRWVDLDPLDETAQRTLMDLYGRSGQKAASFRQYEHLKRLLHEQLGREPEPETQGLCRQLRGQEDMKVSVGLKNPSRSLPLLKTKLYIPSLPATRVERSELIEMLGRVKQASLTLITAPAGFGKTTLLAEWIAQTSLPVAWLSLDHDDNDPYRFLSYLIEALDSIQEGVCLEARQMLQSFQLLPVHLILASLINHLEMITEPYALVLDDYQFVSDRAVHEIMAYLVDHRPANLHIVIATRTDPHLQVGRLRVQGQVLELRTQDLRFRSEETAEFLNRVMMLGLSKENIKILEEKTEGWIVGLKMAALSLRGREEPAEFIRAFSGSNRYVMDYLLDEVLARQEPYVERFLIMTSCLDKLCGPLCDAILGSDWSGGQQLSGQEMLEYLEGANLFVIPLDESRHWYRYHHLLVDLLRTRVSKYSSDLLPTVSLRASRWCEQQGLILDAVKYALDGEDPNQAATLIDGMSRDFISPADFSALQTYIKRISKPILRQHPWTCLAQTHIWVTLGTIDRVEEWLNWVEAYLGRCDKEGKEPDDPGIPLTVALHRAYVRLFEGDLSGATELGSQALQVLQPSHARLHCRLALLVGETYLLQGLFEKSDVNLRQAIDFAKSVPDLYQYTTACYRLTLQLKLQGKLSEAKAIYEENIKLLMNSNLENSPLMIKPLIGLGDIYRERCQLQDAEKFLIQGAKRAEQLGQPNDLVYVYNLMAKYMQARGDMEQAIAYLDKNMDLFRLYPTPEAITQVTKNLRAALMLQKGDAKEAETVLSLPVLSPDAHISFLNELDFTTHARLLISRQNYQAAVQLLSRLAGVAEKGGRMERLIKVLILQAIALDYCGEDELVWTVLRRSLALAGPEGYRRIFLDEGGPILGLLVRLAGTNLPQQIRSFLNELMKSSPA